MKAEDFYDNELSKYKLLNLIDPATAKEAMQMMEEYHKDLVKKLTISTQRETLNAFFEYLDNLTKTEYDANSLTGHSEDYLKSI